MNEKPSGIRHTFNKKSREDTPRFKTTIGQPEQDEVATGNVEQLELGSQIYNRELDEVFEIVNISGDPGNRKFNLKSKATPLKIVLPEKGFEEKFERGLWKMVE